MNHTCTLNFFVDHYEKPIVTILIPAEPVGHDEMSVYRYLQTIQLLSDYFTKDWDAERRKFKVSPFLLKISLAEPALEYLRLLDDVRRGLGIVRSRLLYNPDQTIYNEWIRG